MATLGTKVYGVPCWASKLLVYDSQSLAGALAPGSVSGVSTDAVYAGTASPRKPRSSDSRVTTAVGTVCYRVLLENSIHIGGHSRFRYILFPIR